MTEAIDPFDPGVGRGLGDAHVLACSLSTWRGSPDRCRWCDALLAGRRRRWCSDACSSTAAREHVWSYASHTAKRLAGACKRCGAKPGRAALPDGTFTRRVVLETHHLEHALGRHGLISCIHHSANLEVVCHECHVAGHVAERQAARLERDGPPLEQLRLEVA